MGDDCVAHCPQHYFGRVQAVQLAANSKQNYSKPLLHTQVSQNYSKPLLHTQVSPHFCLVNCLPFKRIKDCLLK